MAYLEQRQREDVQGQRSFCQNLETQIAETEAKLDKLLNGFLDGMIEQDTYLNKKEELLKTKVDLTGAAKEFWQKGRCMV